ncbi:MAG: hypothetical protein H3Z53_03685 [archaeon]|nr:hypothetical protein [archaeon]MCP8313460.1 hypothetical protein [archaeon]
MKKELFKWFSIPMFIILIISLSYAPISVNEATQAVIWTDKQDYTPGETVTIFGSGFLANSDVTVTIERPDRTIDTVYALTDDFGSFTCTYQLDGIEGTYIVNATDGTNTATTTFTDKPTFSITIDTINGYSSPYPILTNPIHLEGHASSTDFPGQLESYQVQVDWGDGTVDSDSTVSFTVLDLDGDGHNDDFSGTWSSSPDHNYASSGTFTITVKIYHVKPPGAESGDAVATATITVQVGITVTTSPSGLSIVVDSVTYTAPQTFNWVPGSTHSIGTTSPQSGGTGIQYVWTSWSDGGAITHNIVVPSTSTTYTANFKTQYYLTVTSAYDSPTGEGWYDSGSTASSSVTSPVSGGAGIQYVATGFSGTGSAPSSGSGTSVSFTITSPSSITWNWKTQYYLTVVSAHGTTGGEGWYDSGATAYATVTPLTVSGPSGVQYVFTHWSGDASGTTSPSDPIIMSGPKTATANWKTQYYLTVVSAYDTPTGQGWYDAGTTATFDMTDTTVSGGAGVQYVFTGWSSSDSGGYTGSDVSHSVTMNNPITETAQWKTQYYLTVTDNISGLSGVATQSGWYDECTYVTLTAPAIVPVSTGVQYRFDYWDVTFPIHMDAPKTATAHYVLQYYLTVTSAYDTPGGTGWYNISSVAHATLTTDIVNHGNGTRRVFAYWGGDASGTNYLQSNPITMDGPKTAVANWKTEYQLTVRTNGLGTHITNVYNGTDVLGTATDAMPYTNWFKKGSLILLNITSPITNGSKRFVFTEWSGGATGSDRPYSITMDTAKDMTANYKTQYLLTIETFGLTGTPKTKVYINGTVADDDFGVSEINDSSTDGWRKWFDASKSQSINVDSPVYQGTDTKYVFTEWTGSLSGSSRPENIQMDEVKMVTVNYKTQYLMTFYQTGLDSSASGTVVTVNGTSKAYSALPNETWVDSGNKIFYSYESIVSSTTTGKQFKLTGVTGPLSPIVVTSPTTVTGNYNIQWRVGFDASSNVKSDGLGAIVKVDGSDVTLPLPFYKWVNDGNPLSYEYYSPIYSSNNPTTTRYLWDSTSGTGSASGQTGQFGSFFVTSSANVTAVYKTQYRVKIDWTGLDAYATGKVVNVTIGGTPNIKNAGDSFFDEWIDEGTTVKYTYEDIISSSITGERYKLDYVTGNSTNASYYFGPISGSINETSNYKTQYNLTITASDNVRSDGDGTIVTVDSADKIGSDLPFTEWLDAGTPVSYSYKSPTVPSSSDPTGTQYRFDHVMVNSTTSSSYSGSFNINGPTTVTGYYVTQYLLTINTNGLPSAYPTNIYLGDLSVGTASDSSPFTKWFDENDLTGTIGVDGIVSGATGTRYVFTEWDEDSSTNNPRASENMNEHKTFTADYKTQYLLTIKTNGLPSPYVSQVYVGGTATADDYGASSINDASTDGWRKWFDASPSETGTIGVDSSIDGATGTRYVFKDWSDETTANPYASLALTGPLTLTANYKTQYQITVTASPSEALGGTFNVTYTQCGTTHTKESHITDWTEWVDAGTSITVSDSQDIIDVSSDTRYKFDYYDPSASVTMDQAKTITLVYKTQYYLTVKTEPSGLTPAPTPTSGWFDENDDVTVTAYSVTGYNFLYWDVDGVSQGIGGNSITVYMDEPHTATAQYGITPAQEYYLTVKTDPEGLVIIPEEGSYDESTSVELTAPATVPVSSGVRYRFDHWDVDGTSQGTGDNQITVHMDVDHIATANYVLQYYLTVTSAHDSPTGQGWYDSGSSATFSISLTTVSGGAGTRYVFTGWVGSYTGSDTSHSVTMNKPITETAQWRTRYYLTVTSARDTPSGAGWYDSGATAHATLTNGIVSGGTGTQYVFTGWSGDASGTGLTSNPITMNRPKTVTANWKTQYYLTVYSFHDFPTGKGWYDSGSTASSSVKSPASGGAGIQHVATGFVGTGSAPSSGSGTFVSFTINSPSSITWNWETQYYLTLATYPSGVTTPSGAGWYDIGTYASIFTEEYVNIIPGSSRCRFNGWTGEITETSSTSTTVLMDEAKTVTANYMVQYLVAFYQSGVDSDFLGTVAIIAGNNYGQSALSTGVKLWTDSSSSISFTYYTPLTSGLGKRYVLLSVDRSSPLTVTASTTVTATYKTISRINPTVILTPSSQSGVAGSTLTYTLSITNNDDPSFGSSEFSLTCSVPSGWTASLSKTSVIIAPGSTDSSATLSVTSSYSASIGNYTVSVTATNTGATSYQGIGSATYSVVSEVPTVESAAMSVALSTFATLGISGAVGKGLLSRLEADFEIEREVGIKQRIRRRWEMIHLTTTILIVGSALFYGHAETINEMSSHVEWGEIVQEMGLLLVQIMILASIVLVISYVARLIIARYLRAKIEYKLWIFGVFSLFITTLLFKAPFGAPGKVNVTKDTPHDVRGILSLLVILVVIATSGILYMLLVLGYPTEIGVYYGLTLATCSAIPVKPLAGHAIYHYNKILSIILLIVCYILFFLYVV